MLMLTLLLGPILLSDLPFSQITSAVHLGDDIYAVTTKAGTHHAFLYDAGNDEINKTAIRNGGGPEEARGLLRAADCGDGTLVFLSTDGKLLHYTHDFEFLAEHHTIYIHIHSLSCTDRRVTMGYTSIVTAEQLTSDEKFIAGVSLSLDSILDVAEIRIPGSAIFLGHTMVFRNNPIVFVEYFVASLKPDEYLIAIKGSPVFFVLSDELQQYTYEHPKLSEAGHIATRRHGYPGQRNGPVNLNWEVVKGDESTSYSFSFGSYGDYREESEHIPYGYVHVSVNNGIQVDYRFYEAAMEDELTGLNHTYALIRGVETSLLHRSFDLHANYLMMSEIPESKSQ